MTYVQNEEAGSGPTLAGLEVAKADSPASPIISENHEKPDEQEKDDDAAIDGDDLFNRIRDFVRRFVIHPSKEALDAHVLWIVHTHLMDSWFATPRLAVLSPEPGSGKTRFLEITALLVPNPMHSVASTAAYVMRKISDQQNRPTFLCDETDAIFGPGRTNEDLRATINAGYRKGATIGRCQMVQNNPVPIDLIIFGAMALGGLGDLPDTIMSRSIVIRIRKRMNGEMVEAFMPQRHEPGGWALRDELERWAASCAESAREAEPLLPVEVTNRDAELWSPLFVVADLAGGDWPKLARAAAREFVLASKKVEAPTLGVQLLADIQLCFQDRDRLPSHELVAELLVDEEAPWGDLKGKKLNQRELAKMLKGYGIKSVTIRMPDDSTPKGYHRADFADAWRRYLPAPKSATTATNATPTHYECKPEVTAGEATDPCGAGDPDVAPIEASQSPEN